MRTESLQFDLDGVETVGPLSRRVTATVANVSGEPLRDARIDLVVACDDSKVEEFGVTLDALDAGESRSLTRTLSVGPTEALALKADGADLRLVARIGDRLERTTGSLDV